METPVSAPTVLLASTRRPAQLEAFGRLLDVLDRLRTECPWDKKQTLQTLRHLTIADFVGFLDGEVPEGLQGLLFIPGAFGAEAVEHVE